MLRAIIYVSVFTFLFSGCSNKFSLQKKRYSKGFYFASNKTKGNANTKTHELKETAAKTNVCVVNKTEEPQIIVSNSIAKKETEVSNENNSPRLLAAGNKIKTTLSQPFNFGKKPFKKLETLKADKKTKLDQKRDPLDFLYAVSAIYYIVSTIIVLIIVFAFLYTALPLNQFIGIVAAIVLIALLICGVSF